VRLLFCFASAFGYICCVAASACVRPAAAPVGRRSIKREKEMKTLLFIGNMGAGELIVIALVVLLLFGGKKIPELMKGLGRGVRSFKEGMSSVETEEGGDAEKR